MMDKWRQEQEQRKRDEDRRLEEAWAEMQRQPFAPSTGETIGTMLGGVVYLAWNAFWLVLSAVVLYLLGRAVVG